MASGTAPLIVGIGGTMSPSSSTERALKTALAAAEQRGAVTRLFGSAHLAALEHYRSGRLNGAAQELIDAVRGADGVIIASPGYHGTVSGLLKNAIDYLEETAGDDRPYLDGVPVGLIATAYGWQAAVNTLAALRSIVHALRGWPTPLGVAINSAGAGSTGETEASARIANLVGQVCGFIELATRVGPTAARRHAVPA